MVHFFDVMDTKLPVFANFAIKNCCFQLNIKERGPVSLFAMRRMHLLVVLSVCVLCCKEESFKCVCKKETGFSIWTLILLVEMAALVSDPIMNHNFEILDY